MRNMICAYLHMQMHGQMCTKKGKFRANINYLRNCLDE